ncbi:hypothetical protein [Shewanella gaetbuli]
MISHIKVIKCISLTSVMLCCLYSVSADADMCPNTPQTVEGIVYCDNQFTLWVNGEKVAVDPVAFTPHQAVKVAFEWDGSSSLTYAIQCEDYASASGYEYIESDKPQLGDGALIAVFNDGLNKGKGTQTSADSWRVHTVTFGPTDESIAAGCSADNLAACVIENRGMPDGWTQAEYDDSHWPIATHFTAKQAGWGRKPTWTATQGCCTLTSPVDRSTIGCDKSINQNQCLSPIVEFANSEAEFIWAQDLDRDNRVLFRYTASCNTQ